MWSSAGIQTEYTNIENELAIDEKNLKDALNQLQSKYEVMEAQRKEKEDRIKSYRELIGIYKKLSLVYQQKIEKIEKVYIKGEELLKALDVLYLNLTQSKGLLDILLDEQKREEEKQLEELRKKHLDGLKELREQYKKFDRGTKKVIKAMKAQEKKQDIFDLNQPDSS